MYQKELYRMGEQKSDEIIESYQNEQNSKLLKQFESLRPKPFASIVSMISVILVLFIFQYFTNFDLFRDDNYVLVMIVIIVSGAGVSEGVQINKRIDLLVKLIKNNAFQRDDT
jgi:magnesium-transporting ATPase (P-type)